MQKGFCNIEINGIKKSFIRIDDDFLHFLIQIYEVSQIEDTSFLLCISVHNDHWPIRGRAEVTGLTCGWSVMRKRMFRNSISAGAGLMIFPVILMLQERN